jgi:hypothetical protein
MKKAGADVSDFDLSDFKSRPSAKKSGKAPVMNLWDPASPGPVASPQAAPTATTPLASHSRTGGALSEGLAGMFSAQPVALQRAERRPGVLLQEFSVSADTNERGLRRAKKLTLVPGSRKPIAQMEDYWWCHFPFHGINLFCDPRIFFPGQLGSTRKTVLTLRQRVAGANVYF